MFKNKKLLYGIAGGSALVLVIVIVIVCLTHCGKKEEDPSESASVVTAESESDKTEEESEVIGDTGFYNPLTGEATATDISNLRPVSMTLNTTELALPQSGISQADVFIEMTEEGGQTRILGIWQDPTGVGTMGPIRSTREYFLSWAMSFDSNMVHCGGDEFVLAYIQNHGSFTIDTISRAEYITWRDAARSASVGKVHALFTNSDNIATYISDAGLETTHAEDADYTTFSFDTDDIIQQTGTPVSKLTVNYSWYKDTVFTYNEEDTDYDISMYFGTSYYDEQNDEQVSVENVLVLYANQWTVEGTERQRYDLTSGSGIYMVDGVYMPITWTKGDYQDEDHYGDAFHVYAEDGSELVMEPGKVFISVVEDESYLVIE